MFGVILKTFITFFAIYGALALVSEVAKSVFCPSPTFDDDVFVILKVCNQQEKLESVVRGIIWKNLTLSNGGYVPNIVIVDMGSTDETAQIAQRLSMDYSFIYFTTCEEFDQFNFKT